MNGAVGTPRTGPGERAPGGHAAAEGPLPLIHTAVARHARRAPDAVALAQGDVRLGYGELDALSDAWAARLAALGAGPGRFVPVLLPRSPALVAALLAVLKCGAAYAALDPAWPARRLSTVLATLRPPVAVAPGPFEGWAGPVWSPPDGDPRDTADRRARSSGAPPSLPAPTGRSPATVFFTSGTTGRPKAVVSAHAATTSLFDAGFAPFPAAPVMPQAAPVGWDAFTLETWGPLIRGGTSVLVERGPLLPAVLRTLADRDGVDTVWLTASLFNLFVDEDPDCFRPLRRVLTGGERLSVPHVRAFMERHSAALFNGYGPVETCVFATVHRVTPEDCDRPGGIPVGRPAPGRRVRVLLDGRPAPPGSIGEICVGGDGVAVGYLGEPELTARAFPVLVPDGRPERIYRTGDLGRFDPDGLLHFAGRADRQVKIRGHRVEPDEVESAARDLKGIGDCAAVPVPGADGTYDRLALFYTGDGTDSELPGASALRRALAVVLPRHLLPDVVRRTDSLPLTGTGKLDRAALAATLLRRDGTRETEEPV
ncbi:amino acid adenylation domain-containing protein [Streptomyces sp. TP-A0356]|uniref:amino acid adenylation domain-containing protein n=1 Tax=Streptomyces sp. TP-A0356 TaxID=1359208 RepID=UPI0006E2D24B|nr:amino acid adenylation domain-containing protein [Streptomyces sp. TP-A0356]